MAIHVLYTSKLKDIGLLLLVKESKSSISYLSGIVWNITATIWSHNWFEVEFIKEEFENIVM